MPRPPGFFDYVKAAFTLSPRVPGLGNLPFNYLMLGTFGVVGLLNPGFWFLGAGVELAYLALLGSHDRFQKVVLGREQLKARQNWAERIQKIGEDLPEKDFDRYLALEQKCQSITRRNLDLTDAPESAEASSEFASLLWMFLRLLVARRLLRKDLQNDAVRKDLRGQRERIAKQLKEPNLDPTLRKTYESTLELLERRMAILDTAESRATYLDAELDRIENQVALMADETSTALRDPQSLGQRIDSITAGLTETGKWIKDLQGPLAEVRESIEDPPFPAGAMEKPMGS